jgi:phosphomannomutase/phosphoglucomutase
VIELYSEPDGRFPNHHPDPTIPKNLEALISMVAKERADLGIAFDGDSDRIGVIDEQGTVLWGDQLMVLFSRDILGDRPGATFVSEVKCSQAMYDDIRSRGGKAIMWKTGHSLIKAKMKEAGAALAGEMSGHIFFADRYFGYDDAIYAACRIVELLKKTRRQKGSNVSIGSLITDLPRTFNTPEIRFDCPDALKFQVVERVKDLYARPGQISLPVREVITVDGVRAVFEQGWGLIRASNTQPVLVMRFEAVDPASLQAIRTLMEEQVRTALAGLR